MLSRSAPVARIIGLLSLLVALAGCSAIRLGYNNLAELSYWWLDGYLDFDDAQAQRVREDLARLHLWHRTQELPKLSQFAVRVEKLLAADVTAEQVCALEPELRERLAAVRERAEPAIVSTALTLTAAQLQHLEHKYSQNNREYTRDWIRRTPAEQVDRRMKQVLDRAETVYGTLDEKQRAVLRQQLQASSHDPAVILAERRRRQQDTLAVLGRLVNQPTPIPEARQAMRGLMDRQLTSPDPAYRAYADTARQDFCRVAATLHNATTPSQREHAVRRLRAWQRDFAELAAGA